VLFLRQIKGTGPGLVCMSLVRGVHHIFMQLKRGNKRSRLKPQAAAAMPRPLDIAGYVQ
jgi:hypothetical protein